MAYAYFNIGDAAVKVLAAKFHFSQILIFNCIFIILFMTVAFAAWFVGMHTLFAFDSIQAGQGVGNEFLYIIAAVIGGCAMTGGRGTAIGTAIGALIFGMTNQGIVYAGWNPDWFKFFLGATLLFAVLTNTSFAKYTKGH